MKNLFRSPESSVPKIVILRALQLGDLLCAVPAWRALRAHFPDARITLISLPWAQEFVDRYCHLLDDFIEFPGLPGFPEREPHVHAWPEFLQRVQAEHFDLAVQMQGSGWLSNPLTMLFGAKQTAGFYKPGEYRPETGWFIPYPEEEHEIWRHLRLMEALGCKVLDGGLEFPLIDRDWAEFEQLRKQYGLKAGSYVCIHPGSRAESRRWPAEKFAAVGDRLVQKGLGIVLTGTESEAEITARVQERMGDPVLDLAGRTSLGALGPLLLGARLLISNDTGVSHVAAALGVPSVVIFSASDPARWAPLNRNLHRVVNGGEDSAGSKIASAQAVLGEAEDLLKGVR